MGDDLGHLVLVGQHADGDRLLDHHLPDLGLGAGHDQVAQRQHADQPPVVVGHVDVVDGLGVGLELAEHVDRLGRGEVGRHRHELGGHDPAGRVLGIAEQLLDLGLLVGLHQGEDLVAGGLGQVGHQVGRVVGRHLLEDVGGPAGLEVLEHLDLGLGLHLLDRVGHGVVIERGQHTGPVARGELVDDRGEVGRMELGQAGVGHPQLDRGDRGLDRVDILPVDVLLGDADVQVAGDRAQAAFHARAGGAGRPCRHRRQPGGARRRPRPGGGR